MSANSIIVVGAGHAGVQAAASLREEGFAGAITLLSDEPELPYQRPPLSKAFLKGQMDLAGLPLRAESFFADHAIDLRRGVRAARLLPAAREIELAGGERLPYEHLVLATGARARQLNAPGLELKGVFALRALRDAVAIREAIGAGKRVVIVGAGFIGLEIAATARALGAEVVIAEIARPLGRAVSPIMSDFFLEAHRQFGAQFRLGLGVSALHGENGALREVELSDGERLPADVAIVGVGVTAEDTLAREAGLACENGVAVDEFLTTSDASISAIGDCAQFPSRDLGAAVRLESVQNAHDHARTLARKIVGKPEPYDALPWFWSDQGDLKLQIAGLSHGVTQWVTRGDPATRAFAVFGFRDGELRVVETVNKGGDHMAARRLIPGRIQLTPEQAADASFDLRKLALGKG